MSQYSESISEGIESYKAWIIHAKTNETVYLKKGITKLGRSEEVSDYKVFGNSAIGRLHAFIENTGDECNLIDNKSINKTFLNSEEIKAEEKYILHDGDIIRLANEKFIFHQTRG